MQLQKIYFSIFRCVSKLKSWWKLSVKETQKVEEQRNQPADVGDWIPSFKMPDDKNVESTKPCLYCDLGS